MAKSGNTYVNKKVAKKNDLQNKAFVFRLKLAKWQEDKLYLYSENVNYIWNHFLKINKRKMFDYNFWAYGLGFDPKTFYTSTKIRKRLNYFDMSRELTKLKQSECDFLYKNSSDTLQQKLKDLDKAISEALDPKNDKKMPRFKDDKSSLSFRSVAKPKIDGNSVLVPKIGWLSFIKSREIEGTPKFITISRTGLHWYVSITTEGEFISKKKHPSKKKIGMSRLGEDLKPREYLTLSNGEQIHAPDPYSKYEEKLGRLQKVLAGKEEGSNNWQKQKDKITKIHTKIANIRKDFIHKLSTKLTREYRHIHFDKIEIAKLTKKSGTSFNKSILDKAWFEFTRQLEYKQLWSQGTAKEVKADIKQIQGKITEKKIAKQLLTVECS